MHGADETEAAAPAANRLSLAILVILSELRGGGT